MLVDQISENRRGNSEVKRKTLLNWKFYLALTEELMACIDAFSDGEDTLGLAFNDTWKHNNIKGHALTP